MQDLQQNHVEIHQSLTRPVLIAGAEREMAILIGFGAALIWLAGKDFTSFLLSIAVWFIGMFLARQAAKIDGQLVKIFLRHIKYQDFYPATEKTEDKNIEGRGMQTLSNLFKKKEIGLPSLVNYFLLADEGIMLNKDGSFLTCFYYRPPDMAASGGQEKDALSGYINEALGLLGTGWLIHVDLIKIPCRGYALSNALPDSMLRVLENERKANFEKEGGHFEIIYALSLTYKSPALADERIQRLFISNTGSNQKTPGITQALNEFRQVTAEIEASLGRHLMIRRMSSKEMLGYLHYCLTGQFVSLNVPQPPIFLNHYLGAYDFTGGISPKIDEHHIGVVAVTGFPQHSFSGMLEFIQGLPFEFRFSSRFIILDPLDAEHRLRNVLIKWHNKQVSIRDIVLETLTGSENQYGNIEAANKAVDAHEAITQAQDGSVKYGYYTTVFVVTGKDRNECRTRLESIRDALRANSFPARIETVNAIEAWRGSLASDGLSNVRQPLLNTLNISHVLQIHGVWTGEEFNPDPKLPPGSPPLLLASTVEGVPFCFQNFVSDIGHTLITGPTGSGKSALLGLITTQFLRYPNAQVFCFDRQYGLYALFSACSARHYEILSDENPVMFCPLQQIQDTSELIWAAGWLEQLIRLQGVVVMTPEKRQAIRNGLEALKADKVKNLSNYYMLIQDREIRGALEPFIHVKDGIMASLMDGEKDSVLDGCLQVFETGRLFQLEPRYIVPVLLYLFHQIDRQLHGQPVMIAIDEAWLILHDPVFVHFLQLWLRELRKAHGCVVFCTQHANDILDSPVKDVIIESTPVKIYMPNPHAATPAEEQAYLKLGLAPVDIHLISSSVPQKHYYYTSPLGKRLIDLELGPVFLSFMGKSNTGDIRQVKLLQKEFSESWPSQWLRIHHLNEEANLWEEMNNSRKEKSNGER